MRSYSRKRKFCVDGEENQNVAEKNENDLENSIQNSPSVS